MSTKQTAKDDIVLMFSIGDSPVYSLRIASRHGHQTGPLIQRELQAMLDSGAKIKIGMNVESPSRFSL